MTAMGTGFSTGVRNFKIGAVTADTINDAGTDGTFTIGTKYTVNTVTQANWAFNIESFDHRGDDKLLEITQVIDKFTVDFEHTGVTPELLAIITGAYVSNFCANAVEVDPTLTAPATSLNGESFEHNLQEVSGYFHIEFDALMSDGKIMGMQLAKCKVSSGPSGSFQDKTVSNQVFQVTAVAPKNTFKPAIRFLRKTS